MLVLSLALSALLSAGPVSAYAVPSAADLSARVKAAEKAHRPRSETEDWTISEAGMSGHQHDARRGDDEVETLVLGPFTTAQGTLGGKSWHQNENGYTIVTGRSEKSFAASSAIVGQTVTRVRTPFDAYLMVTRHANGIVERDYYAPADYLLVRKEYEFQKQTSHVDYTDIRRDNFGRRAWRVEATGPRGLNKYEARLTKLDENPQLDDATFAIPPNRGTLVEWPAGLDTSRISNAIDQHIFVTVNLNGHDVTMALDSGASGIVLDTQVAKELGLPLYGKSTLSIAGDVSALARDRSGGSNRRPDDAQRGDEHRSARLYRRRKTGRRFARLRLHRGRGAAHRL